MGLDIQPATQQRKILVASAPNDAQAIQLVKELRLRGLNVLIAETVGLAALASDMAVCIVVIRPGVWRTTPAVMTAIRCNPPCLIPVLAEAMELPNGAWTMEPVTLDEGEQFMQAVNELASRITSYLQTLPELPSVTRESTTGPLAAIPSSAKLPRAKKSAFPGRTRRGLRLQYILLVIIVLLGGGLLANYLLHPAKSTQSVLPQGTTGSSNADLPYVAAIPGPGCGSGSSVDWQVGDHFKTAVTPVATGTTGASTSPVTPTAQATRQVILDNSTVTTCQKNGLQVTHNEHFDAYATVFFMNKDRIFPRHFSTQVTANVVSGSNSASIGLGVRSQNGTANQDYENGYGNNVFEVEVNGRWEALRYNDVTDDIDTYLAKGFVHPARTFMLSAVVDGPVMTFSVNGVKVTTVTDSTYPNSYGISFGISDPEAKSAPSALFSNFMYTPLPGTGLTTNAAVAIATAQAGKDFQTHYAAPVPGFGCDKGPGQWQPGGDYVTLRCLANGLSMSQSASAAYLGTVSFYWLNGNFPENYSVKAQIDMNKLNGGCAGFTMRADTQAAGYAFFVCSDGFWEIQRFDSKGGNGHQLAHGNVAQRPSYGMEAISNGSRQSLTLDGVQVASVVDKTLTTTDHIELSMFTQQGSPGTAIYSNFVFSPLP